MLTLRIGRIRSTRKLAKRVRNCILRPHHRSLGWVRSLIHAWLLLLPLLGSYRWGLNRRAVSSNWRAVVLKTGLVLLRELLWHVIVLHSWVVDHSWVELWTWRTILRRHGILITALNTAVERLWAHRRILRPRNPGWHLLGRKESGVFRPLIETLIVVSPLLCWLAPFALSRPIFG